MLEHLAKSGHEGVFSPEEIRILVAAFDAAWASAKASGAPITEDRYRDTARNTLAKAIIQVAIDGERDERRLKDAALLALSKTSLRSPRPRSG
jgi:hypothetical protein